MEPPTFVRDASVLIVDDNESNVALLQAILRREGITGLTATTDPRQAADLFRDLQPDLMLLDLHMPHMDGIAVLEATRAATAPDDFVPVVVLTADVTADARERALAAGANDFLTKPLNRTETVLRVRNVLRTRFLHRQLRDHNRTLEARIAAQNEHERQLAEAQRARRRRIEAVLVDGSLTMVFQPIVDLGRGRLVGAEALSRFRSDPPRPPDVWFAEAADVGLGVELELAAVTSAVRAMDGMPPGSYLSINASPQTVLSGGLLDVCTAVDPTRLVIELTEHMRVESYGDLRAGLDSLRREGLRVAIDDAGAGFAGLQHLLGLDPDVIKLDRVLTQGIDADPVRRSLGAALVNFAAEIDAGIVAEGIETRAELDVLQRLRISYGQGYYLGRPGPLPLPVDLPAAVVVDASHVP